MSKQYSVVIQINEDAKWLDGSDGFYEALGGPLDDENNSLVAETLFRLLQRGGIAVVSVAKMKEDLHESAST